MIFFSPFLFVILKTIYWGHNKKTEEKIGFQSARDCIQKVMLEDVIRCIPDVLNVLKKELSESKILRKELMEKKEFKDPSKLTEFCRQSCNESQVAYQ